MDEVPQEMVDWYTKAILSFNKEIKYGGPEDCKIITLSKECSQIRVDYVNILVKLQTSDLETRNMINYLEKIKTYIPRFALVLAEIEMIFNNTTKTWPVFVPNISPEIMKNACQLADYFINTARPVFTQIEEDSEGTKC